MNQLFQDSVELGARTSLIWESFSQTGAGFGNKGKIPEQLRLLPRRGTSTIHRIICGLSKTTESNKTQQRAKELTV